MTTEQLAGDLNFIFIKHEAAHLYYVEPGNDYVRVHQLEDDGVTFMPTDYEAYCRLIAPLSRSLGDYINSNKLNVSVNGPPKRVQFLGHSTFTFSPTTIHIT